MAGGERKKGDGERKGNDYEIEIKPFDELSPREVYGIQEMRYNVFVREQQSIYDEYDGHDFGATHLLVYDEKEGRVLAYSRVYREDEETAVLGRVAVVPENRMGGLGRKIVEKAIGAAREMEGVKRINIGAQTYLQRFYESFGFRATSEPYDDAGVEHVEMRLEW